MCSCSAECHESVAAQTPIQHETREPGLMLDTYFNRPLVLRLIALSVCIAKTLKQALHDHWTGL